MANPAKGCKYRRWRKAVLLKDSLRCVRCDSTENLTAHHKLSFAKEETSRYEIPNGETLCERCHIKEELERIRRY